MRDKAVVAGLVVVLLGSTGYALDPIGPPKALLGEDNWGLGVEYIHSQADTELTDVFFTTPLDNGSGELRADRAYVNLRYGACDDVDVFARLGLSAFEMSLLQDGDADLAWGLGAAATLQDTDRLDWGVLVQFSRGESSEHRMSPIYPYESGTIKVWSLQVAGGPTYQFRDDMAIYGGLFYDMLRGEYDGPAHARFDIEEEDPVGAFGGLDWTVKDNAHWTAELQYAGSTVAVATGLRWTFE